MVAWKDYCGDDVIWDNEAAWNNSSPWLNDCFQKTVLVWLPPSWLLLSLPVLIGSLIKSKASFAWNAFNVLRQVVATALLLVTLADLVVVAAVLPPENKLTADLVNALLNLLFAVLLSVLFYLFVRRAVYSSGALWTYLCLSSICLLLRVVSTFVHRSFQANTDTVLVINCLLTVFLFVQSFLSDSPSHQLKDERKICPKTTASFISRLSFSWYSSLTYIGWRRPIEPKDVWQIRREDSAAHCHESFNQHLERFKARSEALGKPLKVSILRLIWSSLGYYFVTGACFKVFNDLFLFINPMIMKKLMTFVSDPNDPTWHGYIYAVGLFLVTSGQIVSLNYYFNRMQLFGMRVRTQLTTAVYRKALRQSSSSRNKFTTGQTVNLMAIDAQRFVEISTFINLVWSAPFQIVVALIFLYLELGYSVFGGLLIMVLMIPINSYLTKIAKKLQIQQMKLKDSRVMIMNEILSGMKIIKLYGWENHFIEKVENIRKKELVVLKKINFFVCILQMLWTLAPFLVSLITFGIYIAVDNNNVLTAQKAFVSLALFNILRFPLAMLPNVVTSIIMARVSVKRLNDYLSADELTNYVQRQEHKDGNCIKLTNCSFSWSKASSEGGAAEVTIPKSILSKINIQIRNNSFVAIVGSVGSSKSSLLSALLGSMELTEGTISIEKSMRIAYTPQEAWIQNATLRDNILFGRPMDEDYYRKVVQACSLLPDFAILPGGDLTEIGEKGINLSGGQKARVSVARACYNSADIYLFDDPLAAVDSHVGRAIFENILSSETGILRKKTRVLVTNNLSVLPFTDSIFVLKEGQIIESGSYGELLKQQGHFAHLISEYSHSEEAEEKSDDSEGKLAEMNKDAANFKIGSKLVEKEDSQTGRVKWSVYWQYLKSITIFWCTVVTINYIFSQISSAGSSVWLSYWSREAEKDNSKTYYYLTIYGVIGISQGVTNATGWYALTKGVLGAAKNLHNRMLYNIFRSNMAFFDVTPLGRILNRFSKDIDVIDNILQGNIRVMYMCLFSTAATVVVIAYELPIFLAVILPVCIIFYFIQKLYVSTARQLKRLESVSKSPVFSHFSETLSGMLALPGGMYSNLQLFVLLGISTIRAYSACEQFIEKNDNNVDYNNTFFFCSLISNRWLSIRLEMVANLIVLFAAIFAVFERDSLDSSSVGLIISYALNTTQNLNYLVRSTSEIETNVVGVERILEYSSLPMEAEWNIESTKPPSGWPTKGFVDFENYATRYRPGLDLVLKGITVSIEQGEKIGIVGRTGAGKSSLTLALFRLIESAGGCIKIDGIDIGTIGLHQLRQRLTIIPQDPVLFSGTIRSNLDPFSQYSDHELWESLELAHLKKFVTSTEGGLEHVISENGSNLSSGEKQLIALARALLRKTQILIMDEATSAVDFETDSLIQKTVRKEFASTTVLTIAHRLNTIIDSSRVLVLQAGEIAEFDNPQTLLKDETSIFHSMAEAAGLLNYQIK